MKVYWDSSALVVATMDLEVRHRLRDAGQFTRVHALAEVFSTLTGSRLGFRVDAEDAASIVAELADSLEFVELKVGDVIAALRLARERGMGEWGNGGELAGI